MTSFVDRRLFVATEPLDKATLLSQVITSAATASDTLGPLGKVSDRTQNIITILHVSEDGDITQAKLAMCGKAWSRKMDGKRLFRNAPRGSKLMIRQLDPAGIEFPPGEKTSLWIPSSEVEWTLNKGNNRGDGVFTSEELSDLGITDWVIRVHISVTDDPSVAKTRWGAIPVPVAELGSLPGNAKRPGYPVISLSDGQAAFCGIPEPARDDGLPVYPCFINDATGDQAITLPSDKEIIKAMRILWSEGNVVRGLSQENWREATAGPAEPASDVGVPAWAWPPMEEEEDSRQSSNDDESEPSEGN